MKLTEFESPKFVIQPNHDGPARGLPILVANVTGLRAAFLAVYSIHSPALR
jgi:hypothetical protein